MKGCPLDTGFISLLVVNDLALVPLFINPPGIHPEQHFRPVLGIRPPGTGIDRNNCGPGIILPVKGDLQGKTLYLFLQIGQYLCSFLLGRLVRLLPCQFQQHLHILNFRKYSIAGVNKTGDGGAFF